jgi:hypothetical protein
MVVCKQLKMQPNKPSVGQRLQVLIGQANKSQKSPNTNAEGTKNDTLSSRKRKNLFHLMIHKERKRRKRQNSRLLLMIQLIT